MVHGVGIPSRAQVLFGYWYWHTVTLTHTHTEIDHTQKAASREQKTSTLIWLACG